MVGARELLWIRPNVASEVAHWRCSACAIPDQTIRQEALQALSSKRLNIEGAALFAVLPPRRDVALLRLLIAFQVLLDFLDSLSEHPARDPILDGCWLHLALKDALEPDGAIRDYYLHRPAHGDGGYLQALVLTCRQCVLALPSYPAIRPLAIRGAERCGVQGFNHDPDPLRRDRTLQLWAAGSFHCSWGASWWELTAAASSTLGILALLALAADPASGAREARAVDCAYMPWICAASTMLDSYVDAVQDAEQGSHSYIAHYPNAAVAVERTSELVRRAVYEASVLPGGARHALIAAGMVAMYLSCDEARTDAKRNTTRMLVVAGGTLTRLLLPIMRIWRVASELRPA